MTEETPESLNADVHSSALSGEPMAGGAREEFEISPIFDSTWAGFKKYWQLLIPAGFIYMFCTGLAEQFDSTLSVALFGPDSFEIVILTFAAYAFLGVGMTRFYLGVLRDEKPAIELLFSGADRCLKMMGVSLMIGLLTVLGLLLFVIPGFIVFVGTWYAGTRMVDANTGVMDSLRWSWDNTKGHRMTLCLLGFIAGLFNVFGLLLLGVGIFVTIPLTGLMLTEGYRRLALMSDGASQ